MNKRALGLAYLLARFKEEKVDDFVELVSIIVQVTKTNKDKFMDAYQLYKSYLNDSSKWYELKKSFINAMQDFERTNKRITEKLADDYLNKIRIEYNQLVKRSENNLLQGKKYARIYNIEYGQDNEIKLEMSIVTKNMMEYDSIMFNNDIENLNNQQYYRPYFVEFSSDYVSKDYLAKIEFDSLNEGEQWVEIRFVNDKLKTVDNMYISGEYLFSASPLKIGRRKIEIVGIDVPDDVKKFSESYIKKAKKYLYDLKETKAIDNRLNDVFPKNYNKLIITIFNVGQGSLNLIEIDNKQLLFDIGDSKHIGGKIEQRLREKSNKLIKSINPHHVILSHWDLDHILGITKMTDKVFDADWIVPEIPSGGAFSDSAKRLICFLAWYNKTNLIVISSKKNNLNDTTVYSNDVFKLGKGSGETHYSKKSTYLPCKIRGLNYNNNYGLVLKIKGIEEEVFFTGDCEYDALPSNFITNYPEYLVVPHHGSKMIYGDCIDSSRVKTAFISSGKNNYKCKYSKCSDCDSHPHPCHIKFLKEVGYSVYLTSMTDSYVFSIS